MFAMVLPDELKQQIHVSAAHYNMSQSAFVRQAVIDRIANDVRLRDILIADAKAREGVLAQ